MFELSFTFASSSSSSSSFHVRFTRISYRQTLAAGVTCEFLCSRVPGTPVWRLITRERANEPRPQKHSRGRDPLAPAGPESSRDSHGRSWGRVWISTRGSPRYARGRARMCDSASTRRPNARCARLSPRRVRICGDPEEAPRTRHSARARAVARQRRAFQLFLGTLEPLL